MTAQAFVPGADLSHYQSVTDWKKVAASGIKFVILKATEGETGVDTTYPHKRAGAEAAGLLVGAYHFYHYDEKWDVQATHFCNTVGNFVGMLPPWLDLEQDRFRNHKILLSTPDAARKTLAWLSAVSGKSGMTAGVYCDPNFRQTFLQDPGYAKYLLWEASLSSAAPVHIAPWAKLSVWQYKWTGQVPGIQGGGVDMDRFMGTLAELQALVKQSNANTPNETS